MKKSKLTSSYNQIDEIERNMMEGDLPDRKQTRAIINLNHDWKFFLGDEPEAWQKGFNDNEWRTVNIPHDWAVEHPFDIKHSSGTGYLPAGTGFYRKEFFLPEELEGRRVFVKFDGVYNNSMVWCNSYYLGKRPYGYSEFIYDITEFACFGEEPNVLSVRVNHIDVADSRWYTGSGIYRKVTVSVTNNIYIDNYGVFISTKDADRENAVLSVESTVNNLTDKDEKLIIRNSLFDAKGNLVSSVEDDYSISSERKVTASQNLEFSQPQLWSIDLPYLYTCLTEIEKDGKIIDSKETITGIRTFSFDSDQGFFLNGENIKLKGVCVHHDAGCLGAAVRKKVWARRLLLLKEMGCNAIRMSHNPHMPELYELCDELGFLVINEAFDEWEGVKNKWTKGHNVYPPAHYGYYEDFPQWYEEDLATMVLRDRNHPSVILWSIGNEVDYPNDPYCHPVFKTMTGNNDANKPTAERQYNPANPNAERLVPIARELAAIVKKYDESRPVTAALAFPELSNLTGYADCLDVVGYNYKEHLYEGDHREYPDRIIMGSENGKELEQWLAVRDNDYISGQFLWTGFDFLGETKIWPCHGSEAGLLDIAGFKKPAYYFRQSLWSDKAMVKLFALASDKVFDHGNLMYNKDLKADWTFINKEEVQVVCYTNCLKTELFLNGKSLGVKKVSDYNEHYLSWTIPFEKGELRAVSTDKQGRQYEDILIKPGAAAGIVLNTVDEKIRSDGRDITHIILNIVDSDGNIVNNAQDMIFVSIEGPGMLLGLENGNLEDATPYGLSYRRAHHGKLLIYITSTTESGNIKIKAEGKQLKSCQVDIACQ